MEPAAAIILAAGRSTRFGADKLLADFRGQPILQHVVDLANAARLSPVLVVTGPNHAPLDAALRWRVERRVVNRTPESGVASSVRAGIRELLASDVPRVLVLLGDQPLLRTAQLAPLLGTPVDPARPIVVPRYGDGPGNPVLLERPAWRLVDELSGDRGMSQLFARRPHLVRYVDVRGTNPDVDTPDDLAALTRDGG